MNHLDPARLEAWMDGTLDRDELQRLVAHLEADAACPKCGRVLGNGPDLGVLLDLVAAEGAPEVGPTLPERQAMWRRVAARRRPWAALVGALALAAGLAGVVAIRLSEDDAWTVKGGEVQAPVVQLKVATARLQEGGLVVDHRVVEGEAVRPGDVLLFEVWTDRPAARSLVAHRPGGTAELVFPPANAAVELAPAGAGFLMVDNQHVAWEVDAEPGELVFVAEAELGGAAGSARFAVVVEP